MYIVLIFLLLSVSTIFVCLFEKNKNIKIISLVISTAFFILDIISLSLYSIKGYENIFDSKTNTLIVLTISIVYISLLLLYILLKSNKQLTILNYYDKGIKDNNNSVFLIVNNQGNIVSISNSLSDDFYQNFNYKKKNFLELVKQRLQIDKINSDEDITLNEFIDSFINSDSSETSIEIGYSNFKGEKRIVKASINKIVNRQKYLGFVWVGEKQSDYHVLHIEKEFQRINSQNNRRMGLISGFLEVFNDMAFTRELDKNELFLSNELKNIFHLEQNLIDYSDFSSNIETSDLTKHNKIIGELNKTDNTYISQYRYFVNNTYIYLKETGKFISNDISRVILGRIELVPTKHFMKTELFYLDSLLNQSDLESKLGTLIKDSKYFQVMAFSIKNIVDINSRTRDIGNLCIEHVVKTLSALYSSKDNQVYRIYGCVFVLLITDSVRLSNLERTKETNPHSLDTIYNFSSLEIECNVCAGISSYGSSKTVKALINDSIHALKIAISDNYNNNICFFKDIK